MQGNIQYDLTEELKKAADPLNTTETKIKCLEICGDSGQMRLVLSKNGHKKAHLLPTVHSN